MRKSESFRRSFFRRLLLALLGVVLGVGVYLASARNIAGNPLPMPFGTGAAVVLSGSMEPTLSRGDLIFVRQTDTLKPGDIVVYQSGSSLIVHRLCCVTGNTAVTQGDANNTPDTPISIQQIKGVVCVSVPYVGTVLEFLKTPVGIAAVLVLSFALVELSFHREKQQDVQDVEAVKTEIRRLKDELNQKQ